MPRVCIVEPQSHPAPRTLGRRLQELGDFAVRTVDAVPADLEVTEAVVLNSIPPSEGLIPEDRILRFVEGGGGVFAVHDSVFPYGANRQFVAECGIRAAYGATQVVQRPEGLVTEVLLAVSDPRDPLQRFPLRPMAEGAGHPILKGVGEFELADEVWAQNLAPGVRPLISADVGDRVFAPQRFREGPIPISACRTLGKGRLAFFSLGHFAAMYDDPNFLRLSGNTIRWVSKETNERQYRFDLFLSFSSRNEAEALEIFQCAERLGLEVFMDRKEIQPGAIWDEVIRTSLVESRELAVLASPDSLESEWVKTEWGAAWVLQRTITPILFRVAANQLPDRLKQRQFIDFGRHEAYLRTVRDRGDVR